MPPEYKGHFNTTPFPDSAETKSIWDERLHPRDLLGKFESSGSRVTKPDSRDATTAQHFNCRVTLQFHNVEAIKSRSQKLLSKQLSDHEWKELSGAPDGATVIVSPNKTDSEAIDISIIHPEHLQSLDRGIGAQQTIQRSNNGRACSYYGVLFATGAVKGLGQRMMLQTIEKSRALGLENVSLNAAGKAGGKDLSGWKVWPRLGFTAVLTPEI